MSPAVGRLNYQRVFCFTDSSRKAEADCHWVSAAAISPRAVADRAYTTPPPRGTVWVAYRGDWADRRACGVFSSRGAAVRCWAMHLDAPLFVMLRDEGGYIDVEEFELDGAGPVITRD